jgi:hypothetical protein
MYPSKKFIMIQTYPSMKESIAAQQNALDYLKEVRSFMPDATYMCYDNNRLANKSTIEMMEHVNQEIIEDICVIRGDYQYPTQYSSIDDKDMWKIISTPGRLCVAREFGLKEKDLDDKTIEEILIYNMVNTSVMVELERDRIVKRLGLITNLNQSLHKCLDTNLSKLKDLIGEPVEGFEHIYANPEETDINRVIVLMAGLSIPDDRIRKIMQRIDEATEKLTKVKESSVLDDAKTDLIAGLRETSGQCQSREINTDEIFEQFMD